MKKTIIILTALVIFAVSAFATGGKDVPPTVLASLEKKFSNALDIKWTENNAIYSANFHWNSFEITASFNKEGELLSAYRRVDFEQLPLVVSLAIAEKYSGYKVKGMIAEVITNESAGYRLSVENEKEVVELTSSITGDLVVNNKIKK